MPEPTIVALSTPPGMSALAVIRLSGPESFSIVSGLFSKQSLAECKGNTVHFGQWRDAENQLIDEVLVTVFKAPHSYTGEDIVEISCHGSVFIIRQILESLTSRGAHLAKPGEFTQRAYLNGKMDLSQAEAVADLIASETKASHRFAINQLKGGIRKEMRELRERLVYFLSMIELELDFGEEDVEFADRLEFALLLEEIESRMKVMLDSFRIGQAVRSGIHTVIAGKPNAGKSTLLNSLLGDERSLVSDIPGTTRDTVEERMIIGGILFHFIDTAGLRISEDLVERMGIQRAHQKIREADILIYVFDPGEEDALEVGLALSEWKDGIPYRVVVANKLDLNPDLNERAYKESLPSDISWIALSAKDSGQVKHLKNLLYSLASEGKDLQSLPIAINARHVDILQRAMTQLTEARKLFDDRSETDLLAQAIRRMSYELGGITGEISSEELLGNIFGRFCIGK